MKQPLDWEKNLGRDLILSIIKGTVQPKIKIVSSFSHPHVVPNLYTFLSYVEHRRRYSEEFCRTKHLLVPIDFHSKKEILLSQWGPSTVWLPAFFKISFFAQYKKEKNIHLSVIDWGDSWSTCSFVLDLFSGSVDSVHTNCSKWFAKKLNRSELCFLESNVWQWFILSTYFYDAFGKSKLCFSMVWIICKVESSGSCST